MPPWTHVASPWTLAMPAWSHAVPLWTLAVGLCAFVPALLLLAVVAEQRTALAAERALARTDALTGAFNRRAFEEALSRENARQQRARVPFTLLVLDVDGFKDVNDGRGHAAGDALIRDIAHVLGASVRAADVVGRLGGDEFAVLLPETNAVEARVVLERMRGRLAAMCAMAGWPVTFSIGAVTCVESPADAADLLALADLLMYEVKHDGKDGLRFETLGGGNPVLKSAWLAA